MSSKTKTEETAYYVCPSSCQNPSFFQDGIVIATRFFTEEGKFIEDKTYEFIPKTNEMCRGCGKEAIKKIKKVTIVTEIN